MIENSVRQTVRCMITKHLATYVGTQERWVGTRLLHSSCGCRTVAAFSPTRGVCILWHRIHQWVTFFWSQPSHNGTFMYQHSRAVMWCISRSWSSSSSSRPFLERSAASRNSQTIYTTSSASFNLTCNFVVGPHMSTWHQSQSWWIMPGLPIFCAPLFHIRLKNRINWGRPGNKHIQDTCTCNIWTCRISAPSSFTCYMSNLVRAGHLSVQSCCSRTVSASAACCCPILSASAAAPWHLCSTCISDIHNCQASSAGMFPSVVPFVSVPDPTNPSTDHF